MEDSIKKRRLVLIRETVMPLQRDQLLDVHGGKGTSNSRTSQDNASDRAAESLQASGASSAAASAVVSLTIVESAGACPWVSGAASGAYSAVTGSVDHASEKQGKPCWLATSLVSASIHFSHKW